MEQLDQPEKFQFLVDLQDLISAMKLILFHQNMIIFLKILN